MTTEPYRVCVVCWGNICRSPMGEFLLREAFEDAGLGDRVVVDSAGTSSEELGNGMHRRTAAVLRRNGHEDNGWGEHVARRFEPGWFDRYDLVLPVDHVHVERLERIARTDADRAKLRLFRSFDPDAVARGELGMDDPWYGTDPAYDQTYAEISRRARHRRVRARELAPASSDLSARVITPDGIGAAKCCRECRGELDGPRAGLTGDRARAVGTRHPAARGSGRMGAWPAPPPRPASRHPPPSPTPSRPSRSVRSTGATAASWRRSSTTSPRPRSTARGCTSRSSG